MRVNDGLKQRLIGAIVVLLALGVLLLPALFDGQKRRVDQTSQVPATPEELPEPLTWTEPQPLYNDNDVSLPDTADDNAQAPVTEEEFSTAPVVDAAGGVNAWSLQVASFQSAQRSSALVEELIDAGYTAYGRSSTGSEGEKLYRVYVGPKLNKADLLAEKTALDERLGTKAFIVRYRAFSALDEN